MGTQQEIAKKIIDNDANWDFVPKGSDFTLIAKKYWYEIENILNNRPRKIWGLKPRMNW